MGRLGEVSAAAVGGPKDEEQPLCPAGSEQPLGAQEAAAAVVPAALVALLCAQPGPGGSQLLSEHEGCFGVCVPPLARSAHSPKPRLGEAAAVGEAFPG